MSLKKHTQTTFSSIVLFEIQMDEQELTQSLEKISEGMKIKITTEGAHFYRATIAYPDHVQKAFIQEQYVTPAIRKMTQPTDQKIRKLIQKLGGKISEDQD